MYCKDCRSRYKIRGFIWTKVSEVILILIRDLGLVHPNWSVYCFHNPTPNQLTVVSKYPLCWHQLFGNIVIATGFPIPKRNDAIGLGIDVPLMASLSGIVCEAARGEGLILRGLSTALIPTKNIESGTAIQWHLFSDNDDQSLRS